MRKLTSPEISIFAKYLYFTYTEAQRITDVFYSEKAKNNFRLARPMLDNVDDYIREWENNWYRYYTWEQLLESEVDQGCSGLTESECVDLLGKAIFQITDTLYIQTVF